MKTLKQILGNIEEYISGVLLALMVLLVFMQIIFRFILNWPLRWTEESARYAMIILIYMSACTGVKKGKHIRIEAIENILPGRLSLAYWVLGNVLWFAFNSFMVYYGFKTAMLIYSTNQVSPVLHVSMGLLYMVIPVCFTIMDVRIVQRVAERFAIEKKAATEGGAEK